MPGTGTNKRIQLTLFAGEAEAAGLEALRRKFNPEQYALIKCHITLCREDELEQVDEVIKNLASLRSGQIRIELGRARRFSEGKGVLIPAIGANEAFHNLRKNVLKGVIESPRRHEAHITIMHPRNSTCTNEIFAQIEQCEIPGSLLFSKISLIEQEAGMKWTIIREFALHAEQPGL